MRQGGGGGGGSCADAMLTIREHRHHSQGVKRRAGDTGSRTLRQLRDAVRHPPPVSQAAPERGRSEI